MGKPKRKKNKSGAGRPAPSVDPESLASEAETIRATLSAEKPGPEWGVIQRLLMKAKSDPSAVGRAVASRDLELIDLLTVSPMDTRTLCESVAKTGRCVIVHEGHRTCGIASEIIARINEHSFEYLEAPIRRLTGFDIPFPYFQTEQHFLPDADDIVEAVRETLAWE